MSLSDTFLSLLPPHSLSLFLLILSHSSSSFSLSPPPPPPLSPHSPPPLSIYPSYEIQLSEAVRRKGLGKFLIQLLELIGHKTAMKKVVLTVFKGVAAILDACSLWWSVVFLLGQNWQKILHQTSSSGTGWGEWVTLPKMNFEPIKKVLNVRICIWGVQPLPLGSGCKESLSWRNFLAWLMT